MKNWNDLSDDELDELFRQSAEKKQVEFDEGAWDKMNQLLDNVSEAPKTNKWLKRSAILTLILFLGSFGVYLGLQQYNKNKSAQIGVDSPNTKGNTYSNNKIAKNTPVINDTNNNKLSDIPDKNSEKGENVSDLNKKEKDKISTKKLNENDQLKLKFNKNKFEPIANKKEMIERTVSVETSNKPTLKPLLSDLNAQNLNKKDSWKNSNNSAEKQTKNRQKPKKANIKYLDLAVKNTEKKDNLNENKLVNKLKQDNTTSIQTADKVSEKEPEAGLKNMILVGNLLPNLAYHKFNPNFFIEVLAPTLPKIEPKPAEHFKKGLSIRLAYSPDISTVGQNEITKIGSNWGALLEYRLSKHLIVQSGIIKSIKYYDAYPEQYDWVWGKPASKLMEINAVCKMLDIPLNIRYDIIANNKSRIFVSTGLTSYLMMKEKYHYDYEDNANPNIKRRDWSGKTGMYKSSNLNLSVGFEKQVARSLTLQIEPFAKSPLKNIGFGKVPLITYGLMFSADYQLKNLFKK